MVKLVSVSLFLTLISSSAIARGTQAHVEWKTIVALVFGGMVLSFAVFLGSSSSKDKSNALLWCLGFGLLFLIIWIFSASPEFGFVLVALCALYFYRKQTSGKPLNRVDCSDTTPATPHQNFMGNHNHEKNTSKLNTGWGQINRRPKSTLEESCNTNPLETLEQRRNTKDSDPPDSWPYIQQEKVSNWENNHNALRDLLIAQMKRNSSNKNSTDTPSSNT